MKLSAIVITKNAADKIEDCLESLKFADEVIVVDSGSTDATKDIAVKAGAKFFKVDNIGYSHSRNVGAQKAKGEWLLYVDADERVTENLQKEILPNLPKSPNFQSFKIYRKNIILGQWLRHGGWWPDPVHRLIKKSALREWQGELHEYPVVEGEAGTITEPIVHYSKNSISEMVKNSRQFAPIEAELKLKAGHPPVKIYHFILAMWGEFWTRGILKAGWLDGVVGIIEIFYQMFHQFMVYSILWQMQQTKRVKSNE
ncbi:glycosyltransferase family 2 protein [Candidatus Collierbacteria bacterium]|nr:glycosyltransferase family 2 protein [Candidatus Collierbacteria bacterium]